MGPVETLAVRPDGTAELTVLGQQFIGRLANIDVSVGQYVLAASHEGGELAILMPMDVAYVPGASTVWLTGTVEVVDQDVGQVSVGGVSLDYTAVLSRHPTLSLEVGDVIDVSGIQPAPGGSVIVNLLKWQ
jgi:hypothetical protein